jgi:hypothetical protein
VIDCFDELKCHKAQGFVPITSDGGQEGKGVKRIAGGLRFVKTDKEI